VGPVIVQPDASIDADAVVVGPTVIGAGAHVASAATVVQSVIAHGVTVFPAAVVRGRALYHQDSEADVVRQPPAAVSDPRPSLLRVVEPERSRATYAFVKSAIDRLVALAALLILSPVMAIVAVLIKTESRGRVLFADLREGLGGRPFRCIKFRTMVEGSDRRQRELLRQNQVDGPQFKLEKDPRLTRIGRWLRPMSLDELPQLFNVLRGEMSLIGPRPSPFRENQTCVPWRDARLSVRPGITGLWQVCRHDRQAGDFHQWIHFDLLYVRHMSFGLDLKILLATIWTRGGKDHVPLRWMIRDRTHSL
jgi:lipopolysaccharide/colanic/teichoic acid biosynthesis glycosyltransferase